ncbi:flagellar motor protein MotB [Nocardioides sp. GY 10127]|uniref:flagellar motor protein MotB n=1 Tax=Nocardioides sp. GY 10127 TaxID=2569762 RepID=UPI0010A8576D|nr:flagellar motor protein MotB [Nocardioides sp. GY 10127]TIC78636.1 flagellar motor protein [Nocardioides sp. GY 10127]
MSGHGGGHGGGRRAKHEEHEEHENHERWLVSYADMVTLLFVLFVVLFAMAQVDQTKFEALAASLRTGFGNGDPAVLNGAQSIMPEQGTQQVQSVQPLVDVGQMTQDQQQEVADAVRKNQQLQRDRALAGAKSEVDRLTEIRDKIFAALDAEGLAADVKATFDERGLVLSLVSKHVVFESNLASLSPRGREIVATMAPVLRRLSDPLQIDGHTNQAAGAPKYYASDWDLSAARAITVLRLLEDRYGISEDRLSATGYGHTKPLLDPSKPRSQEINKRVDVVILANLTPEEQALLAEAVNEKAKEARAAASADSTSSTDSEAGTATDTTTKTSKNAEKTAEKTASAQTEKTSTSSEQGAGR